MSSRATATAPMPSVAATSRTPASPPVVSSAGRLRRRRTRARRTRPTSAGQARPGEGPPQHRAGRRDAAATRARRAGASEEVRPVDDSTAAEPGRGAGRRQRGLLDGAVRAQCPRRPRRRRTPQGCSRQRTRSSAYQVQRLHRPRVRDAVADDPRRVARPPAGPGRWSAGSGRSGWVMTVTPIVSTARQSGRTSIRVISPSATLMSSWCACRPSRRLSERRPSPAASIRPWCSRTPPWSSRTRRELPRARRCRSPRSRARRRRVLVAGRLPGHRHLRGAVGLQQHGRGRRRAPGPARGRRTDSASAAAATSLRRGASPGSRRRRSSSTEDMRIPCHLASRDPPGRRCRHRGEPGPDAGCRADRRPVGRRGQGQGHRPARWPRPLRRPLPGRQQRRPHGDHPGRREVRAAPDPVGHPDARAARRSSATASSSTPRC